ncbi:MAG: tetraacyldisaccharide 4'-kinase [Planctomycetota bacterium]|nr:tetraacyldisaccharide 4'-kinase [Planctomycetota bacterium]
MIQQLKELIASKSNSLGALALKAALWCASQPYAAGVWLRNAAFDRQFKKTTHVGVPIISVGNLTAGGTGKTPMVAHLAHWFRERNRRIAILSRGYGAGVDGRNDEAKELERGLPDVPHLQSPDRIAMARIAIDELDMEVLLLDDGFQHRRIARSLEIVLLDAREPFGFGYLLPRGLLREPIRSLKRADIVVATRADQVDAKQLASIRSRVQRYAPKVAWLEAAHVPKGLRNAEGLTQEIDWLKDRNVLAICGIGSPDAFFQTLQSLGANVVNKIVFPDHHDYQAGDIREIAVAAETIDCDAIICTGKDLAKIDVSMIERFPIYSLDIEMEILFGKEILEDHLKEIIRQIPQESA